MLTHLQKIERKLGRSFLYDKWSPRTIDLDILSCEQNIFESETLTIPHSLLLERSFALTPLLDIDPSWIHPKYSNKNLHHLLTKLEPVEILPYPLEGSKIMGVLNLTPISMSGPNQTLTEDELKQEFVRMVNEGAEIIDIGAESTRPGATLLSPAEEWERLQPVLINLKSILSDTRLLIQPKISIDTYHAATVEQLKNFDIDIVNDVSGTEKKMIAPFLKGTKKKYVLVHNMGRAGKNYMQCSDEETVVHMISWFEQQINELITLGLNKNQIIVDPGIGFGKKKNQTAMIIKHIGQFKRLGCPILVGHSRKASAMPSVANLTPLDRDLETAWLSKYFAKENIDFIRVHNCRLNRRIIDEKVSLIVAHQINNGIGFKNKLPWSLKEDKKHFRTVTLNKTVIMGRKTFESIDHPLELRRNIVLSRTLPSTIKDIEGHIQARSATRFKFLLNT